MVMFIRITEVWSGKSRTTTWNINGNVYTYHDGEESAGGQESSGVHPGRRLQNDAKSGLPGVGGVVICSKPVEIKHSALSFGPPYHYVS